MAMHSRTQTKTKIRSTPSSSNPSSSNFWSVSLLLMAVLLVAGCGDGRAARVPVGGSVTVDGETLAFGSITFIPIKEGNKPTRAGGGPLRDDGSYQVTSFKPNDGLLKGKYEVMISGIEPISESAQRWHAPRKYANTKTSGLTVEIVEENKELNFDLSWKGAKPGKPFVEKF